MPTFLPSESAPSAQATPAEPIRLLEHIETWRSLRIEQRRTAAALYHRNRERAIGTLDMQTGTLTVDADRDVIGPLRERHSELQLTDRGVQLDVTDAAGLECAEALLRWRLDLERFGWQLRVASP